MWGGYLLLLALLAVLAWLVFSPPAAPHVGTRALPGTAAATVAVAGPGATGGLSAGAWVGASIAIVAVVGLAALAGRAWARRRAEDRYDKLVPVVRELVRNVDEVLDELAVSKDKDIIERTGGKEPDWDQWRDSVYTALDEKRFSYKQLQNTALEMVTHLSVLEPSEERLRVFVDHFATRPQVAGLFDMPRTYYAQRNNYNGWKPPKKRKG
jgi:hypothetical protein